MRYLRFASRGLGGRDEYTEERLGRRTLEMTVVGTGQCVHGDLFYNVAEFLYMFQIIHSKMNLRILQIYFK